MQYLGSLSGNRIHSVSETSKDISIAGLIGSMSGRENSNDRLLALLGDEAVRIILTATDERPMSAQMLDQCCDASLSTIYRRIEDLLDHKLLRSHTKVRADGNHCDLYESNLERLDVTLENGDFDVELTRRNDAPDHFRNIWDSMQERDE